MPAIGRPVALVSVKLEGVPPAPLNRTGAPAEPVLTPRAVRMPVPVVVVAGAAPAPPPIIKALAARRPEDESVVVAEKYGTPPLVVVPPTVCGNDIEPAPQPEPASVIPEAVDHLTQLPLTIAPFCGVNEPVDRGATASAVATPAPNPETPVEIGRPVALVSVPLDGVPRAPPLTTNAPAVPTLTPRAVATPVPSPVTPATGRPVAFVSVRLEGVPPRR